MYRNPTRPVLSPALFTARSGTALSHRARIARRVSRSAVSTLVGACRWFTVALLPLVQTDALACSTCMVGDPTLTLMGTEKPYAGRLRMSLDYFSRDEEIGVEGVNKRTIDDQRTRLDIAYAPTRRIMLGLRIPYVNRTLESFNLATQESTALGDVRLTAKFFLQEKDHFQTHMYGLLAGVRLPTASEQSENGVPLEFDAQPGVGSAIYNAGLWYSYFKFPWMLYLTGTFHYMPEEGFQGFRAGNALSTVIGVQYASDYNIAYQLAYQSRYSEKDTFFDIDDPDSGGYIGFIAPGLVYSIKTDLLFFANVRVPVIENLNGNHEEGTIFNIGVTYDFK